MLGAPRGGDVGLPRKSASVAPTFEQSTSFIVDI